jgi:hypothetical protein
VQFTLSRAVKPPATLVEQTAKAARGRWAWPMTMKRNHVREFFQRLDREWWGWFVAILMMLGLFSFMEPTLLMLVAGDFSEKQVLEAVSPTHELRVVVTRHVSFPPTEWLDPAITVTARLYDSRSGAEVDQMIVWLPEQSDLGTPTAHWQGEAVVIRQIDNEHHLSITLRLGHDR